MSLLHILSGPVIGAVIGYFTNYIAVKMLFRPYHPVKLGGITLPFTPGIIPKRKDALAAAIGSAVSNSLLKDDDIKGILLSQGMQDAVTQGIVGSLSGEEKVTVQNLAASCMSEKAYEEYKVNFVDFMTNKVTEGIEKIDLGNVISTQGASALKNMDLGMMAMFINENTIAMFAKPIGEKLNEYIQNEGHEKIRDFISEEVRKGEEKDLKELEDKYQQIDTKRLIGRAYVNMVEKKADDIVKEFHISEIIQEKIQNMGVRELEELVMSVMRNELNMIVKLGALIGFVIGILNVVV